MVDDTLTQEKYDFISHLNEYLSPDNETMLFDEFGIDSKYYKVDDLCDSVAINNSYKYSALHLNVQGLQSSIETLKIMLARCNEKNIHFDFILICESFLHGTDPDMIKMQKLKCHITGYQLEIRNRSTIKHGGLAIYIKDSFSYKERPDLSIYEEGSFKSLFFEVKSNTSHAIFGEIYRVPDSH